jgi:hypothetical protein
MKKELECRVHKMDFYKIEVPNLIEVPTYSEWVKYGSDNKYPEYLQSLINRSSLHNAIITSKIDNTTGEGFIFNDDTNFDLTDNKEEYDEEYKKIVTDYIVYGGYAVKVKWSKESVMTKKTKFISSFEHIPFDQVRTGKKDPEGNINNYFVSNDWSNYRKIDNIPVEYPTYNPEAKEPFQIYFFKEYRPGVKYYPKPTYVGALASIQTDAEISNFHLANLLNGFNPNLVITFVNGIPTTEEQEKTEEKIIKKFTGTDNAGKNIINFVEDKDHAPIVKPVSNSNLDKLFLQLETSVHQNILTGHKITSPMLVGIKTEGQLGGNNEIETSFKIFQSTVIKPIRKATLTFFKELQRINKLDEFEIEVNTPIDFTFSETILKEILTNTELRAMIGYYPKEVEVVEPEVEEKLELINE